MANIYLSDDARLLKIQKQLHEFYTFLVLRQHQKEDKI